MQITKIKGGYKASSYNGASICKNRKSAIEAQLMLLFWRAGNIKKIYANPIIKTYKRI